MAVTRRKIDAGGLTITVVATTKEPDEIRQMLWSPGAPGDVDLKRRATAVADMARRTAPVGKGPTAGTLARSFSVRQARTIGGKFDSGYEVVSNAPHAIYVIKGTRPHTIEPHAEEGVLVFDWPAGGMHPAFFRRVNHPGTRGNPFFANATRAAV